MDKKSLLQHYHSIRKKTEELCQPLDIEMYVIQSHPDVSPPKWHLAHTTWFFETFILKTQKNYQLFDPLFHYLFNSYYKTQGNAYPRDQRGLLARPSVKEVYEYRKYVDDAIDDLINRLENLDKIAHLCTLGLNHEQQHQELLLMDLKYNFNIDPSYPSYQSSTTAKSKATLKLEFIEQNGGLIAIGAEEKHFCFDNELPRHHYYLKPFSIANRLINNQEYLQFINEDGYHRPELWLDDGWYYSQKNAINAPLYWKLIDNKWYEYTLHGLQPLDLTAPVAHISYYEADAYARYKQARLPTEFEWEHCAATLSNLTGNFLDKENFHPHAAHKQDNALMQLFGDLWEWTSSAYLPYPGFKSLPGSLGEYNGKFMNNQMVLRGGCCVTPQDHIRTSYRNFFQQDKRWQFSGIRLCKDID